MDSSKFNLWRACFLFCRIDGVISPEEKKWIDEKTSILPFTEEQKSTLKKDSTSAPQIDDLIKGITKPSDRAFLVDQMRVLSKIDGQLTSSEQKKLEEFRAQVLSKINLKELETVVSKEETPEDGQGSVLDRILNFIIKD